MARRSPGLRPRARHSPIGGLTVRIATTILLILPVHLLHLSVSPEESVQQDRSFMLLAQLLFVARRSPSW